MKIGIGSWSYRAWFDAGKCDIFSFLDEVRRVGAEGVEIFPRHVDREADPDVLAKVKARCQAKGLDVATLICGNNFAASKAADRARAVAHMVRDIEQGAAVGISRFNTFTGYHEPGQDPQMEVARVVDCYREVMPAAEARGALLCIENHSSVCQDADGLLWLFKAVGSPNLKSNPDPSNFVRGYFEVPEALREPIYAETEKIAPHAANAHLKYRDFRPDGSHAHIDVARILDIYRKAGYDGWIILEYSGREDPAEPTAQCVAELRRLIG